MSLSKHNEFSEKRKTVLVLFPLAEKLKKVASEKNKK